MELIDSPALPPGSCFLTGTDTGPFIDTLIDFADLPAFGRAYLSADAVRSMAQMLGWEPGDKAGRLRAENRRLRDELTAKEEALDLERQANAALHRAGYRSPPTKKETSRGLQAEPV